MAQLSAAIDGIAEACTTLETPITGGNVSLYNETRGEGIYPTPVLGIVGILEDVSKAVPAHFQRGGEAIVLMWPVPRGEEPNPDLKVPIRPEATDSESSTAPGIMGDEPVIVSEEAPLTGQMAGAELAAFGSSEYAKVVLGGLWGTPPPIDLEAEADLHTLLGVLADRQLISSARDLGDGGIAVALAQSAFRHGIGARVEQEQSLMVHPLFGLFAEPASTVLLTTDASQLDAVEELADEYGFFAARIGTTGGDRLELAVYKETFISASVEEVRKPWATALESALHEEVLA
jgi:phosphoribosylformylglycinamidine synthase subunit PurL